MANFLIGIITDIFSDAGGWVMKELNICDEVE